MCFALIVFFSPLGFSSSSDLGIPLLALNGTLRVLLAVPALWALVSVNSALLSFPPPHFLPLTSRQMNTFGFHFQFEFEFRSCLFRFMFKLSEIFVRLPELPIWYLLQSRQKAIQGQRMRALGKVPI